MTLVSRLSKFELEVGKRAKIQIQVLLTAHAIKYVCFRANLRRPPPLPWQHYFLYKDLSGFHKIYLLLG